MTEEQIFLAALDLPDAVARNAYLDEACGEQGALRQQVEALLASHFKSGEFLDIPAPEQISVEPSEPTVNSGLSHAVTIASDVMPAHQAPSNESESLEFLAPPTRPDSLGRIDHYEVLQVLGTGGFGIVFRAFDDVLQRVVAIKVMAPLLAATSPARKRFLREARASAQVRHENVVQVYEVGEQPLPYLVMEFIPGETLQQRVDRVGPLDVPETLQISRQIAEGLAAAHAMDLIHRDIKPGNVLLEGGQHKVKITDFGLARAADDASVTQSGQIAGTPMYMAPEQALGRTLDYRLDLFSLGSVMYQMVAGRPPFRANTAVAVLKRVVEDTPRNIREVIPETPQWLCDIIAKLHAKNPDDRYQSAREVADVLADCEEQLKANSKLKDYSRIPRGRRSSSGPRRWIAAAAALLLPVLALALTEFAGVTHLFREQQAKVDTTTLGPETPPVANSGLSANSSAIGPIATPEPPADFREVHGVERAAFDIWLGEMKRAKYVPQTLAAWNTENGDGRFAAVAIRDPQVIDWDVVYFVGPIDDLQSDRLELLSKTGFRPAARALNVSTSAIQTADLWIKYPSNRHYTIFRGGLQLLNTRLAECRANSMRPTYLCVTRGPNGPWSFGHIYSRDDGLKWEVKVQINRADLLEELNDYRAKNWRLDCLAVYGEGIQSLFLVGFVENSENVEWSASLDLSTAEYEQELVSHRKLGMCPRQVSAREFGGTTRYSVIWQHAGGKPILPAAPVAMQEPLPPTFKNGIGMEFVLVPKGKSWLGGGQDKLGDKEVEIPADFYLGKYEITQEEWKQVMGENPSYFSRTGGGMDAVKNISDRDLKRFPVENLSWDQCQSFVAKLNSREKETGWVYRLPREAEWEYACRGGPMADRADSAFDFYFARPTNTLSPNQANFNSGTIENLIGLNRTCVVGSYEPNVLGLYDMHGNVWEACDDIATAGNVDAKRVNRGGSWYFLSRASSAAFRDEVPPSQAYFGMGLRLARVPAGAASPAAKPPTLAVAPFTDADVQRIAALPAVEQIEEVRKELIRRNPGFDGKLDQTIEGDVVTELHVNTDEVEDISPVRALIGLVYLDCRGTYRDKGKLSDLSPLAGMTISRLDCSSTQVSDLSPLADLPLTFLAVNHNPVSDLTPLKKMPLESLGIAETKVSDLSPLQGMKIKTLGAQLLPVTDLSPLAGMPLTGLDLYHTIGVTSLEPLRGMPLENLNLQDVPVADLSPLKGMTTLRTLLLQGNNVSDLSPLAGLKLTDLLLFDKQIVDLTPLKGMPLTRLHIYNSGVSDLRPLQGLPLVEVRLSPKDITQGLDVLREIKTLQTIGIDGTQAWPAAEFWDRLGRGEFK